MQFLDLDNDNDIDLEAATVRRTGVFFTVAATVTAKLIDAAGTEVVAAQTLAFVSGSNGDFASTWDKTLLPSLTITPGRYLLQYDAAEAGAEYHAKVPVEVRVRPA